MPRKVTADEEAQYFAFRSTGHAMREASQMAGISLTYARKLEGQRSDGGIISPLAARKGNAGGSTDVPGVKRWKDLCPEAKRAWDDFGYFQRRYFGRIPSPWQEMAAEEIVAQMETPSEAYIVQNAPPGSGKTLLVTHDVPAWLTVRNRAIRGMLGSLTGPLATRYTRRLRTTLERTSPEKADLTDLKKGLAYDAEATLAQDFGTFKPVGNGIWTAEAFICEQDPDRGVSSEKEPTWSAYGIDMGFIGGRYNYVAWDDMTDPRKHRSAESKANLEDDYDDLCETRLDPGGLMILNGQRIGSDDLYRYALDKVVPEDIDPETGDVVAESKKYFHLCFKAHDITKCQPAFHRLDAPAWPEGCLLSPRRLPWRKLSAAKANSSERFEVIYQQEDVDPQSVLVPKNWVYGDDTHQGCLDHDRDRLEIPQGLAAGATLSVACADPSPTKYWGITWWLYHAPSEQRFLIDLLKHSLEAPEFLDWNANSGVFSGVMEEWQQTSVDLGRPITHWIVEINAAQRFLLQFDHVQRWMRKRNVTIVPHSTNRNKSDAQYGVQTVGPHWEHGRVRLPYKGHTQGRLDSLKLIEEVTNYPHGRTDDLLMSEWFFEWQLPHLFRPDTAPTMLWRPSWARGRKIR